MCARAFLCVCEGHLGWSFVRNGNFILKVLRFFQYNIVSQCICKMFKWILLLTEWISDTLQFPLKIYPVSKRNISVKLFFSYYIIWFIRLLSSFPSESECQGWLQNFRFYKWVKSKALIFLFVFSNFASWSFALMVLGQIVRGNLRPKEIPWLLNCLQL